MFRDLEAYASQTFMFREQWAPYKYYTMCKYYGNVVPFLPTPAGEGAPSAMFTALLARTRSTSTWRVRLHQFGELEVLQMDHSMRKHVICAQWLEDRGGMVA
jgi:hypothetical protein